MDQLKGRQRGAMGLMRNQERLTARSAANMGNMQRGMLMGAARYMAPLAGMLAAKEVVSAAANFQAAMNRVEAALGATGPEFKQLGDLAKDMGRTTSFSANEAAGAIEMLAKNGLDASQILGGALKTSMLVAAASGSELSGSADLVTDVMANFNVKAGDLGKVADGITGVLLQSKFGFEDYRLALAQAGGMAGGVGVTLDDFNTTITATSGAFASGSDAGTSFKTFLARLVPSSKSAAKAMEKLNLEFFENDGSMKSMSAIAEELKDGLKGLSDEARNEYLQDIFGTDAIRTAIGLAKQGGAGMDTIQSKIGEAKASEQAAARMKGFWGEVEQTKSALEGLAINLGDMGLPALEGGLAKSRDYITQIAEGIDKLQFDLDIAGIDDAKAAVGALLETIGDVMTMGGGDTVIEQTFKRLAASANMVANGINVTRDALQAMGLAAPDGDTAADTKGHRDSIVDGFAEINPLVGPAVKGVYDVTTGRRGVAETDALRADNDRRRLQMGGGKTLAELDAERSAYWQKKNARLGDKAVAATAGTIKYSPMALPAAPPADLVRRIPTPTRRPSVAAEMAGIPQRPAAAATPPVAAAVPPAQAPIAPIEVPVTPKITDEGRAAIEAEIRAIDQRLGALQAAATNVVPGDGAADTVRAAADAMDQLMQQRDALDAKLQTPLAALTVPPVDTVAFDTARSAADTTGAAIRTALNVTARPTVDTGSITGAQAAVERLAASLRAIPGLSRAASDAAQTARVDYSGLHADLSRAG